MVLSVSSLWAMRQAYFAGSNTDTTDRMKGSQGWWISGGEKYPLLAKMKTPECIKRGMIRYGNYVLH